MGSFQGKKVAEELIDKVRKGEKINMQEIQKRHGYSKASAKSMKAKETDSFKEVMNPFVDKMMKERERVIDALSNKNLSKEKYRDMMDGLDKLTKNIQLLTGGDTGKEKISFTWE
jgi:23S rRNA pseudoU1915 N3-methylase RlmH